MFDPKLMCETERCSARTLQIVYHDWFKDVAKAHRPLIAGAAMTDVKHPVGDMCYNNSWRAHKGKLFVLVSPPEAIVLFLKTLVVHHANCTQPRPDLAFSEHIGC